MPGGKMLSQMPGVLAEFEHSLIQEPVRAGQGRARVQGPGLAARIPVSLEAALRKAPSAEKGIRGLPRSCGSA